MNEKLAWTYEGGDRYHGVPQRDLTDRDYEALGSRRQRIVRESPSYRSVETPDAQTVRAIDEPELEEQAAAASEEQ